MTTQARELASLVDNSGNLNLKGAISRKSDSLAQNFGADNDVSLTHVHNTGLLLNSTRQLQFGDSGTYINQSADGVLNLTSDTEVEINATTLDINANVDVSGNIVLAGTITVGDADDDNMIINANVNSHIIPNTDDTFDLGSSGQQWRNVYVDGTLEADAITVGGVTLAETIADTAGAMFTSNTETGITATYQDGDNTVDLVVGTLNQDTTGTADLFTASANNSTDETVYPVFVDGATGSQGAETDTGLTYNPSSGILTATQFTGAVVGAVTGNVTGNASGTAATVTTAAQPAITSLGTLTTLTVDNVIINGTTIGHTGDTDLMTLTSGVLTVAGEVDATTLDISGDADIDGTLEADAITIDGVTLSETIADTVGAMVSSNTETNIAVTYEDGDNTLDFVIGTLNQDTSGTAALATSITASANNSTDETVYPTFVDGATGTQGIETDTGLTYNPSSGILTGTQFTGAVVGNVTGDASGTAATVTTAAQPAITSLGTLTTLTVDDMTLNGSTITDAGDFTIDSGGDIILDADGANIKVKDNGTTFFDIQHSGNDAQLHSRISDGDLVFRGNDGGSTIDALTLDMSEGGVATFRDKIVATELDISGNADIDGTLEADVITVDGTALNEYIADTVGAMVGSNTESGIAVAYQDGDNTLDFTVATLNQDTTGLAGTATALATGRTIGMTGDVVWTSPSFDGSGNVTAAATIQTDAVDIAMLSATGTASSSTFLRGDNSWTAVSTSLTVGADSGSDDTVTVGTDTLDFVGTSNEIETTVSNNQIQIGLPNNVTISGNLTVSGDTVTVNTSTLAVEDPLISLATGNNAADAVDIGIYGLYDTSGSQDLYGGLFRDASDSGKWKLFKDNQAAPITTVDTSGTGYAVGTLVGNLEGNVTGNVTGNTSGTAATVTTAAQTNITSLGTLTGLTGGTGDFNWDSNTLVVDSSASMVGIGTASPGALLETYNATDNTKHWRIHRPGTAEFGIGISGSDMVISTCSGMPPTSNYSGIYLRFNTAFIGINKPTPAYTLDVDGDINFTGTLREDGSAYSAGIGKGVAMILAGLFNG